jgi:3-oxoacyl-[acyl-carrier-protein] synthase-1
LRPVYVISENIISSLGFTTDENIEAIKAGKTGIELHRDNTISPLPFWASMINRNRLNQKFSEKADPTKYTVFEKLTLTSIVESLKNSNVDITSPRVKFILSTTKGNIDLLDKNNAGRLFQPERVYLWHTAGIIQAFFGLAHIPLVISNACISGVLATITGARLIRSGKFDHIVICGADIITEFVLSGFNSFQSLCEGPCKPFDKDRLGLSLGEAAGTLVLSANENPDNKVKIQAGIGFSSNDANHISGPSRTGEGLFIAIHKTLEKSGVQPGFVSAHGTATAYNDEMESIALTRAELQDIPVNSMKGYWGHTLGAAGVIEIITGLISLKNNMLFKTLGYKVPGVSNPIAVIEKTAEHKLNSFLKIASGFGGSNAAMIFFK